MTDSLLKAKRPTRRSVGAAIILIMCLLSFGALAAGADYSTPDLGALSLSPRPSHIFGTDTVGRDILSRTLVGGAYSIMIGVACSVISTAVGVVFGALAGYFKGAWDFILLRLSELTQSFPFTVAVLLFASVTGRRGIGALITVFSATGWMTVFRIVRTEYAALSGENFVIAARRFGMSRMRIMFTEILPNAAPPILVSAASNVAFFILQEAALSFIGFGVPETTPTWGNMLNAARSPAVLAGKWWIWLFPGLACSLFVLAADMALDGGVRRRAGNTKSKGNKVGE